MRYCHTCKTWLHIFKRSILVGNVCDEIFSKTTLITLGLISVPCLFVLVQLIMELWEKSFSWIQRSILCPTNSEHLTFTMTTTELPIPTIRIILVQDFPCLPLMMQGSCNAPMASFPPFLGHSPWKMMNPLRPNSRLASLEKSRQYFDSMLQQRSRIV